MPVSFLNPWLWIGALAVAAPVWLHLRRKRQTGIVLFSTLRFLQEQPEPRRSPMRLRHLVLFLVRLLALLMVVTAFSWPYVRRADTIPVKESRVYILDNTLSHQAGNGFVHDRNRLLSELQQASREIQIAVIELTSAPRVIVALGDDRQTAQQRVQQLTPSFQRGSYLAAFRQANAILSNSLGHQKRIVFLGDNQSNQWAEHVNTPAFLRNIQVDLPKTPVTVLPNLFLSDARAQRIFLGEKSLINFTVKLSHEGPAKTAKVTLQANGQIIFSRTVELEKQPPTLLLQAQWEAEPDSWLRGEARVEGTPDALPADNRIFFSLAPLREGKVALLAQSPYLKLALSPEIMKGQWATRLLEPAALSQEMSGGQEADLLFLEGNYLQSTDARKLVWRYLTNGRGVVLAVNRLTPVIRAALSELGFEAGEHFQPANDQNEKFQFVSFNHPIFHPFLSPDYGNLMEIKVAQYCPLKPTQAMPLIFSDRGAGLFFQGTKFPGKLFVLGFGLDREQSSWPVHQSFIPFLDLLMQAARAEDPVPTALEPGEVVQVPAPGSAHEVVLRDDHQELARAKVDLGKAQVRMPDQPGWYALSYDASPNVDYLFSVNPSPRESELAFVENPEAVRLWSSRAPQETKLSMATASPGLRTILQQRLWWWMVLGGLLALLLEMALAQTRSKRA